jgi:hypothetical protein
MGVWQRILSSFRSSNRAARRARKRTYQPGFEVLDNGAALIAIAFHAANLAARRLL